LNALALRMEVAREEERARVARELHDELGQVLTSLKLEFMWLVDELRKAEPKPGIQLVNKLQALTGLIEVSKSAFSRCVRSPAISGLRCSTTSG
jgi:signal transduction histidine kinase